MICKFVKFNTRAIHSGQEADKETGAVVPPIHLSSTFKQDGVGNHKGFEYSRTGNPTRQILETNLASLENGKYALAFASGSATTTTLQLLLKKGDHVIVGDDVYGGTFRFFDKVMKNFGVTYSFVDTTKLTNITNAITSSTKMVWFETPSNPLLKISDIQAISNICKSNNLISVVDNTFATPFLQNPLDMGIDIVMHSTTKYIGGHSDVIGGALITNNSELYERLKFLQNAGGAVPSPFDCWLVLRGIKTLGIRMERHSSNAEKVMRFLEGKIDEGHVEELYYPFYSPHKNSDIAKKQMKFGGGMISFDIVGGKEMANEFLSHLKYFTLAESLGGVESLAEYPPSMTHGSYTPDERLERGIKDGLVRLSVGIEDIEDLLDDLEHAFKNLKIDIDEIKAVKH